MNEGTKRTKGLGETVNLVTFAFILLDNIQIEDRRLCLVQGVRVSKSCFPLTHEASHMSYMYYSTHDGMKE